MSFRAYPLKEHGEPHPLKIPREMKYLTDEGGTRLESLCKINFRRPDSQKRATMSLRMFLIDNISNFWCMTLTLGRVANNGMMTPMHMS